MEDDDDMDDDDGDDVQRRHVKEEDEYSPSSELLEMYGRAPGLCEYSANMSGNRGFSSLYVHPRMFSLLIIFLPQVD